MTLRGCQKLQPTSGEILIPNLNLFMLFMLKGQETIMILSSEDRLTIAVNCA